MIKERKEEAVEWDERMRSDNKSKHRHLHHTRCIKGETNNLCISLVVKVFCVMKENCGNQVPVGSSIEMYKRRTI